MMQRKLTSILVVITLVCLSLSGWTRTRCSTPTIPCSGSQIEETVVTEEVDAEAGMKPFTDPTRESMAYQCEFSVQDKNSGDYLELNGERTQGPSVESKTQSWHEFKREYRGETRDYVSSYVMINNSLSFRTADGESNLHLIVSYRLYEVATGQRRGEYESTQQSMTLFLKEGEAPQKMSDYETEVVKENLPHETEVSQLDAFMSGNWQTFTIDLDRNLRVTVNCKRKNK